MNNSGLDVAELKSELNILDPSNIKFCEEDFTFNFGSKVINKFFAFRHSNLMKSSL